MEIISLIKEKLTDSAIEKVSNFLGEHPEKISSALHSAVPTVLGSIAQNATSDESSGKLMDILKDGGHTGEILDDLPNLLGNFDKTQLLITIGTNIFNHFTGNKSNGIVEKMASLNGIRKTSSASILGLAAPLVLGAIGKVVAKEGLGISGLTKLLSDQKDSITGALPPAIASQLSMKSTDPMPQIASENKEKKTNSDSKNNTNWWIPLLLLTILALGAFAYWWKYKRQAVSKTVQSEVSVLPKIDSTKTDGFDSAPADTTTSAVNVEPAKEVQSEKIEETKTEPKKDIPTKAEEPKKIEVENKPTFSNSTNSGSFSEQLKSGNSWINLSSTDFGKNSAELRKKGELDELANFLKKNRKAKIQIAGGSESSGRLAEDRSYAAWGYLLEKGVKENQIEVKTSQIKDANGKIVIKVIKK